VRLVASALYVLPTNRRAAGTQTLDQKRGSAHSRQLSIESAIAVAVHQSKHHDEHERCDLPEESPEHDPTLAHVPHVTSLR
jgi:hypothetical protein